MGEVVVIGGLFRELLPGSPQLDRRPGGSGFVAALTAAAMGAEVSLVSFLGEEDRAALRPLARAGVDVSTVQVLPGQAGTFSFVDLLDRRAPQPTYRTADSIPATAPPPGTRTAPVVLAFGFPDFNPREWIRAGVQSGGTVLWDRQGWLSRSIEPAFFSSLPVSCRVHVANISELKDELDVQTAFAALDALPPTLFDAALVKAGRWGTLVAFPEATHMIEAYMSDGRSSIGSGDCFAGAVAARLAAGDELAVAARAGAAAASIYVEHPGNRPPGALAEGVMKVIESRPRCFVSPARCEDLRVYLAGPWFTIAEDLLITVLEAILDHLGLEVVSPRRDIGRLPQDASPEAVLRIGRADYAAIDKCDLVVAVLDGDDPGTLMEVGYAAKAEKPIIGLSSRPEPVPSPMREASGVRVADTIDGLIARVTEWVRKTIGLG